MFEALFLFFFGSLIAGGQMHFSSVVLEAAGSSLITALGTLAGDR